MRLAHLCASPFFGGIERQALGLARALPRAFESVFILFMEGDRSLPFYRQIQVHGLQTAVLRYNTPHFLAVLRELTGQLRRLNVDLLLCHGYKPDILGWQAARQVGIPVVAIAHGWTGATFKVRCYESLDRWAMRHMDIVVCVSEGQAAKVRQAGVANERVQVIRNAIDPGAYLTPDPAYRHILREFFPGEAPRHIVAAAGRFSPEKGFDQLIAAAAIVRQNNSDIGFVLFGDGPLRIVLAKAIADRGLQDYVILPGFRADLEKFFPHFDLFVLPSYTEGLPVVALEALASQVPVVATAVGGTPEVVRDGENGFLVPPGQPKEMAQRIDAIFQNEASRLKMGRHGRDRVLTEFSFASQSLAYQDLLKHLVARRKKRQGGPARYDQVINLALTAI